MTAQKLNNSRCVRTFGPQVFHHSVNIQRCCVIRTHISAAILDPWTQPPVRRWPRSSPELSEQPRLEKGTLSEANWHSYLPSPAWSGHTLPCPCRWYNTFLSKPLTTQTAHSLTHELSGHVKVCFTCCICGRMGCRRGEKQAHVFDFRLFFFFNGLYQ